MATSDAASSRLVISGDIYADNLYGTVVNTNNVTSNATSVAASSVVSDTSTVSVAVPSVFLLQS